MASEWHDGLTLVQRAFFVLLRSGLWESSVEELALFPLSDSEWQQVYSLAEQQTVQGLLYRGFQHLPTHLHPPQPLVWKWVAVAARLEQEYRRFAEATQTTRTLLQDMGLKPVLQKGIAVAAYYEHPELRKNGDIDWFIGEETDTDSVCHELKARGLDYEVRADRSICFVYGDVDVELHRQLVDLEVPRHRRGLNENEDENDNLNEKGALVMLSAHIFKHVCTVGIGLRQFCDMARAYHTLYGCYDKVNLIETYRQTGLLKWSGLMHQVLVHFLGLPADEIPASVSALTSDGRHLVHSILHWGNFGQHASTPSKLNTISQIVCNLPFSLRYSPAEAAYRIWNLIKGQKR